MLQLKEFLDENSHRSYPFKNHNNLPTELILDMHILISGVESTVDYKDKVGVSKVIVSKTGMSITFVTVEESTRTVIGTINIPITEPQATHIFSLYKNEVLLDGSITIGYISSEFIGTYNIPVDSCLIFEGCVIPVTNWCTGLVIDDKLYTGLVTINVSDGLTVEAQDTQDGCNLNFKLKEYSTIQDTEIVSTIENHFQEIVDTQGFIKTINGVSPDAVGNINITIGEPLKGEVPDYVKGATILYDTSLVNTLSIESGYNSSLIIRDEITPFCYDEAMFTIDDAVLETLKANADELADRVQTIENHLTALENNLNTVNMQLVKMG